MEEKSVLRVEVKEVTGKDEVHQKKEAEEVQDPTLGCLARTARWRSA